MAKSRPRKMAMVRPRAAPRPAPAPGVDRASRRYERKLALGRATVRSDGNQALQVEHFRQSREQAARLEDAVRAELDRFRVARVLFASYYGFARHVAGLCRRYQYATLDELVEVALVRWTMLGLDRAVLQAVAGLVRTRPGLAGTAAADV